MIPTSASADAAVASAEKAGAGDSVGARSDIYSLGAILYELVTLRVPHDKDNAEDFAKSILKGKIASPRSIRAEIPVALEECIVHALSRNPENRYSSVSSLAADLERFMRGEYPLARNLKALKERVLTHDGPAFSFPTRVAVAVTLTVLLCIAIFSGRQLQFSQKIEETASGALKYLDRQQYGEARETADRLISLNSDNSTAQALGQLVTRAANSEAAARHQIQALKALLVGDKKSALNEIRQARDLLPLEETLVALEKEARKAAHRDPLSDSLADHREPIRVAALRVLKDDLATGRRSRDDFRLAKPALFDPSLGVRQSAFRLFGVSSSSEPLLEAMGVDEGNDPVRIDEASFLSLHETLRNIGDEKSIGLLSKWPFETMHKLDGLPASSSVDLPPNLRVTIGQRSGASSGSFTRSWIAIAPKIEPNALHALALQPTRPELRSDTITALTSVGGPHAAETISKIARRHYVNHGMTAIQALKRMQATASLSHVMNSHLPLPYREASLSALGESSRDDALPILEEAFANNPEVVLRNRAFHYLSRHNVGTWDPTETLLKAVEEPKLREQALDWLDRLGSERRSNLSLVLVSHPTPEVRERATKILSTDRSTLNFALLVAKAFDPSPAVRQAALRTIAARNDLARALQVLSDRAQHYSQRAETQFKNFVRTRADTWESAWQEKLSQAQKLARFLGQTKKNP